MTPKRMLFVYNPKSGKAKIKEFLFEIIDVFSQAGYVVTTYPTKYPGDAKQTVKDREQGMYDLVVCCGGDGTLDEVVTGMMQCEEKLPIGYIPAGSTNDFATNLGISNNMVEAAEEIITGSLFPCDIGKFNEEAFVYVAAFGAFTEVSYATDQQMKNTLGHVAYILEGVKSLSSLTSYKMKFETGDRVIEGDFIYGMITNSISVGGFKDITGEDVQLDDGEFEVTLIRYPTTLVELNDIIVSLVTKKMNSKYIENFKASWVRVESEKEVNWALDGEFGGSHTVVSIKNEQKALSIITK